MQGQLLAHGHGSWGPGEVAALSAALVAAAVAVAGLLLLVRALVKRRSSARSPCPGCGTFLAPGEECPVCPRQDRESIEEDGSHP
jgi:hypothetical protein